jgi:hypothetical protein
VALGSSRATTLARSPWAVVSTVTLGIWPQFGEGIRPCGRLVTGLRAVAGLADVADHFGAVVVREGACLGESGGLGDAP